MKMVLPVLGFAALAASFPALADDPKPETKPADTAIVVTGEGAQDDPKLDKIVCRTDKAVGSRLNTAKVCKTRRQWIADKEQDRRDVDRIQANRSTSGG